MAKKFSFTEFAKVSGALVLSSSALADGGLYLADYLRLLRAAPGDYIAGPIFIVTLASLPATLRLASKLADIVSPANRPIIAYADGPGPRLREIPINGGNFTGSILASVAPSLFTQSKAPTGLNAPAEKERINYTPSVFWRVPVDETTVTIREAELMTFLEVAYKRSKHQFSRNYWLKTRRPRMWRAKYEAFMKLLTSAGLIDGRHEQGGASGRLNIFPREAVRYLKYESQFAIR